MTQPLCIIALRTHLWSPAIAAQAARLQQAAPGCRFVILADETKGPLNTAPFEKISHTVDFSAFALPAFPAGRVLWYNADYPLYTLQQHFPDATHFLVAEYDVSVNIPLLPVLQHAYTQKLDLIAHFLGPAPDSWGWTHEVKAHFRAPMQSFLPLCLISARAVRHLLHRRQTWPLQSPTEHAHWPFCEAFIPTVVQELQDCRMEGWQKHASTTHFTLDRTLPPTHSTATLPGSIAHPVRSHPGVHDLAAGRAVRKHAGTGPGDHGWWQSDVGHIWPLQTIILDHRPGGPAGRLIISTSQDGTAWTPHCSAAASSGRESVTLPAPVMARFVRVTLLGPGVPGLRNVEVYAPPT